MQRFVSLLACTVIFVLSSTAAAWEFNTDGDTEGWMPNPRIADLRVKDGVMTATMAANTTDPFISVTGVPPWDANDITGAIAKKTRSASISDSVPETFLKVFRPFW